MITIHHARRSRSARVIWLLEELGVPYQLHTLEFTQAALQSAEHKRFHPLGLVPVIQDGELTMIESGAILQYLLERYGQGRLAPASTSSNWPEYLQWFHFGEATLANYVSDIVRNRFGFPENERSEEVVTYARRRLRQSLELVDHTLAGRDYILGAEFTAADIMLSYGMVMARITKELPAEFANVASYLERLKQRPAYAKAWA